MGLPTKRTVVVRLEIDVEDMAEAELHEAAWDFNESAEGPTIADYEASDVVDGLAYSVKETSAELFAGSSVFLKLTDVRLTDASWAPSTIEQST